MVGVCIPVSSRTALSDSLMMVVNVIMDTALKRSFSEVVKGFRAWRGKNGFMFTNDSLHSDRERRHRKTIK